MDTSESAIFHGLEMSRKSWAYQNDGVLSTSKILEKQWNASAQVF
ncbi:hypothetical protein XAC3810_130001 [Xanthomonas citri pv. citri]|uniref:Uncharacterized protein n=1 Tax=Xanthomonas citri pv. citri TaxID=611301 RepID=A0A0U5F8A8_XANCI|nr:hypothetical protein XAC3824_130001 [Xanthomonas citri pv. citri]CEE18410.1 hypothetical protein XAC1083_140001 [Xanthomonas citri pv. citri]CEE24876.1 hypothetical protein XAC3810_130001 [Xanthomonas citri pv. citri]CEE58677.1 hypothetical protein XAC2852_150001 [Xanthomonas citri pv. citri]CEE66179.1 hypothetical protein XACLC80_130001 [Xanthomonas citri pv. citri]